MENRITEANLVEAMASGADNAAIENRLLAQIGKSVALPIDDGAVAFVANILTPQGALDRKLKNFLRGATRSSLCWVTIARMARTGSRTKFYAEKRASEISA